VECGVASAVELLPDDNVFSPVRIVKVSPLLTLKDGQLNKGGCFSSITPHSALHIPNLTRFLLTFQGNNANFRYLIV
jgi:hypothetical protein